MPEARVATDLLEILPPPSGTSPQLLEALGPPRRTASESGLETSDAAEGEGGHANPAPGEDEAPCGSQDPLSLPTPGGGETLAPGAYSTLMDVREHLEDDATAGGQRDALGRVLGRARRRLDTLRARGLRPCELESRLRAAETLGRQGKARAALILVEEILVLAKVMAEFGEAGDPLELRIAEQVAGRMNALLRGQELGRRVGAVVDPMLGELEARLLPRIEEGRQALSEQLHALDARQRADLEMRIEALLAEERFARAAAAATAADPDALLDRPETLARIDALARRAADDLLDTTDFREEVDERIRRSSGAQDVQALVDARVKRGIEAAFKSQALDALLAAKLEATLDAWLASPALSLLVDARARALIEDQIKSLPAPSARAPAFGAGELARSRDLQDVMDARFKQLLAQEFKRRKAKRKAPRERTPKKEPRGKAKKKVKKGPRAPGL